METSTAVIWLAVCAAVTLWALKMALSERKAKYDNFALQQMNDSSAAAGDGSVSTADTAPEVPEPDAENEGAARYYVKRTRPVAESTIEESA